MKSRVKQSAFPLLLLVIPAVLMFSLFLSTTGPLTNSDPDLHLYNIYSLATGQAFTPAREWTDAVGNVQKVQYIEVDQRLLGLDETMNNKPTFMFIGLPYQQDEKYDAQFDALTQDEFSGTDVKPIRSQYFPLIYTPQALVYGAGMSAGLTPWTSLKLVRICVFLLSLAIECVAIWILPRGKTIFALVGIMPITVFLQSSISTDGLTTSCIMLLVALFAYGYVKRYYSPAVLIASVAVIVFLFLNKYIYAMLALPFLFVPEDILSRRAKIIAVGVSLLISLGLYGGWKLTTGASYVCTGIDLAANKAWIVGHIPQVVFSILLTFFLTPVFFITLPEAVRIPFLIVGIAAVVLSAGPLVKDARKLAFKEWLAKWRFFASGCVAVCLAILALLVSLVVIWHGFETHPWPYFLEGVQERYFIPFLPLLVLALYPVTAAPAKAVGEPEDATALEE